MKKPWSIVGEAMRQETMPPGIVAHANCPFSKMDN